MSAAETILSPEAVTGAHSDSGPAACSAPQTACEILCEWAWAKVNLENLQRAHQGKPPEEGATQITTAIHAFQHALRKKKRLDVQYREHHEANRNAGGRDA